MRSEEQAIEIFTADQGAELLGVNRKTIYEAASRGDIPHRRLGRRLIFERGAVLRWLRQDAPSRKTDFDFLTFEEAEAFIAAAKQHPPHWHPFVVVALRTGLRIGELIALRWREDIDLARGRVTVQQSYNPHNGFTSTKNDKIRELPLTWDAIAALEAQRELVDADSELVFPGADGEVLSCAGSQSARSRSGSVTARSS